MGRTTKFASDVSKWPLLSGQFPNPLPFETSLFEESLEGQHFPHQSLSNDGFRGRDRYWKGPAVHNMNECVLRVRSHTWPAGPQEVAQKTMEGKLL